jgi:hypothetical protein
VEWWTRTSVLEIVLPLAVRHKAAPPCMCSATDSFTCSESITVARRSLPKPDHLLPCGSKPVLGVLAAEWSIRGLDTFAVSFPQSSTTLLNIDGPPGGEMAGGDQSGEREGDLVPEGADEVSCVPSYHQVFRLSSTSIQDSQPVPWPFMATLGEEIFMLRPFLACSR